MYSKIPNLEYTTEFTALSNVSLNVDQDIVLSILLGEDIDIKASQLKDYYIFFKSVGLKYQCYYVCRLVEKTETFSELCNSFRELTETGEENDIIKSWFSLSPSILEIVCENSFNTAFGMSLFDRMKCYEKTISEDINNLILVGANLILHHLAKYKLGEELEKHKDFSDCDLDSVTPLSLLKKLFEDKRLANITLRSNDEVDCKCHKEILILRFNFFHLMFRFRGAEVQEYEESGRVRLEDISSNMMNALLSYAYTRDFEIKKNLEGLENILGLIIHCHQFNESDLYEVCLRKLTQLAKDLKESKETGLCDVIAKIGVMLHINDEVREKVIPSLTVLMDKSSEDYVRNLIKTTYERHEETEETKKLEEENKIKGDENKNLKDEVEELKKEIERLNKLIERSGDDSSVFGGGRVRKRGNDDEKVEEENPKKRRKKE